MNKIFETYKSILCEFKKKYGHTLWIDPRGKVIDISKSNVTHFDWLINKLKPSDKNDIYALASSNGWIQVRNHTYMTTLGSSVSFTGSKSAMKKNRNAIFAIIDESLFDGSNSKFFVDFTFEDDNGNPIGERKGFAMPKDDVKLRRFI